MFSRVRDSSDLNTLPLVQCTAGCAGSRSIFTAKGEVCPVVFKTPLYSTPSTPTQCKAGYNGTGSNCTACAAGTYKNFTGSGGCCCPPYHDAGNARLDPIRRIKRAWPAVSSNLRLHNTPSAHSAHNRFQNSQPKPEPPNPNPKPQSQTPNLKPTTHKLQPQTSKPEPPAPHP